MEMDGGREECGNVEEERKQELGKAMGASTDKQLAGPSDCA